MFSTELAPIYQEILDSRYSAPMLTVYVGGRLLTTSAATAETITGFTSQHQIGATATGTLDLLLPRIPEITYNSVVEVQAGYNGYMDTIFNGIIPEWEDSIQNRGNESKITLRGWTELLKKELRWDLVFQGPINLDAIFVSLCQMVGIPNYIVPPSITLDGDPLRIGGNTQIEEGKVTFSAGSSLLSQFNRLAEPYGYSAYDLPTGHVVLARILGTPTDTPLVVFTEGVTSFEQASFRYDSTTVINYFDVEGPTFEDEFGGKVPIRSRPESGGSHPAIPGDGVRYKRINNNDLVRQDLADLARAVLELNASEPEKRAKIASEAISGMHPGHVAQIVAPGADIDDTYWVTAVDQTYAGGGGGYTATYDLWAGAGETQPSLVEQIVIPVRTEALHLGDEYLTHYAQPAPQGQSMEWQMTIPFRATTVNLRGWHHGTNSQILAGVQTELDITKWEMRIDQDSEDPEASGNMPVVDENLSQRLPYWDGLTYWKPFAVSFNNVEAGDRWFKIIMGDEHGLDDCEVSGVYLEIYGSVEPAGFEEID